MAGLRCFLNKLVVAIWDRRGTIDCRGTRGCTRENTARQEEMEWPDAAGDYCATANAEVRSTIAWRYWYMLWKYRSTNRTLQNASESGSTSGTTDSSSDTSDSSDWKKRLRSTWKWEEIFDSLLFTIRISWNMQGIRTCWPKTWKTIIHSLKIDDIQLDNKYWPWPKYKIFFLI